MTIKIKPTQNSDEALMNRFINHQEEDAFGILYQKYFPLLSKYLGWLNNDLEKGKDLAQNIFLKIYQNPNAFDHSKNFKVWIFSIAKNHWKNEIRDTSTRLKHHELFSKLPVESFSEKEINSKRLKDLKIALEDLSENHREVFVLKYSNNLSLQEISEVCNCSVGTVKSRLFYALQNLKKSLK